MYSFGFSLTSVTSGGALARDFPFHTVGLREDEGSGVATGTTSQSLDTRTLPSGSMIRGSDTTLKSRN